MIELKMFQHHEEFTENTDKLSYRKNIDFPLVFLTSELLSELPQNYHVFQISNS